MSCDSEWRQRVEDGCQNDTMLSMSAIGLICHDAGTCGECGLGTILHVGLVSIASSCTNYLVNISNS